MRILNRWLSLLAVWPLLGAAPAPAPKTNEALPAWLIGTWMPVKIYQWDDAHYGDSEPQTYFPGKPLTVSPEHISFTDFSCHNPKITHLRAPLRTILRQAESGPKDISYNEMNMPTPGPEPLGYLKIRCHNVWVDEGDGKGYQPTHRPIETWSIILRSHNRIEMPFYFTSYVIFQRVTPTS